MSSGLNLRITYRKGKWPQVCKWGTYKTLWKIQLLYFSLFFIRLFVIDVLHCYTRYFRSFCLSNCPYAQREINVTSLFKRDYSTGYLMFGVLQFLFRSTHRYLVPRIAGTLPSWGLHRSSDLVSFRWYRVSHPSLYRLLFELDPLRQGAHLYPRSVSLSFLEERIPFEVTTLLNIRLFGSHVFLLTWSYPYPSFPETTSRGKVSVMGPTRTDDWSGHWNFLSWEDLESNT